MKYEMMRKKTEEFIGSFKNEKLKKTYKNCFYSTLDTTLKIMEDGTSYVFTGDIPAMWLRDSSAQVMHYIEHINDDPEVKRMIKGLITAQLNYIKKDPYANAFNESGNNNGHKTDITEHNPWVWERKFEIDSLCYPIFLSYKYYKTGNDTSIFDDFYKEVVKIIIDTFKIEQRHHEKSKYVHYRPGEDDKFSVPNKGKGGEVGYTGMIWSGYRPSDDACEYGYFIPGNIFAVVILRQLEEIFSEINADADLKNECEELRKEIEAGIEKYGITEHEKYGKIYAYETDGLGNYIFMDDANVPSLLSLPYLGYCGVDDQIYANTRAFVLSGENPYYFKGKYMEGVGSPHTPHKYVWHIGIIMRALTSRDENEIREAFNTLLATDAEKCLMHEGVNVDNPNEYTREWFAWANSLFAYFIKNKYEYLKEIL